jgi:5-methyltetrahydropteroyltriglutamate--homocysteine methyltransferase
MIITHDVGSFPLRVKPSVLWDGARTSQSVLSLLGTHGDVSKVFEDEIVESFKDKLQAGIDIPNYPQFRDMNEMFLEMIRGIKKADGGYIVTGDISSKPRASIPEVDALKRNVSSVKGLAEVDEFRMKMCVTGPYTLASFFQSKDPNLFEKLGRAIADITSNSLFSMRGAEVKLLWIDEPVLGFLNDPLLDYGSEGRDTLRGAWETICREASAKNVETGIHLHNTSDNLFWEVEHLNVVESHVDDPLYSSTSTKRLLEETDKRMKASISITIFDNLIENKLREKGEHEDLLQQIADKWSEINNKVVDPHIFLETSELMLARLRKIINYFGPEYVQYAGPECGLKSFPTYESAIECLRRISRAVDEFNAAEK